MYSIKGSQVIHYIIKYGVDRLCPVQYVPSTRISTRAIMSCPEPVLRKTKAIQRNPRLVHIALTPIPLCCRPSTTKSPSASQSISISYHESFSPCINHPCLLSHTKTTTTPAITVTNSSEDTHSKHRFLRFFWCWRASHDSLLYA